ncbi:MULTISPECIES: aminomethyl transferase family protein [Micrococcaceae]|uniref:aminomethyl transferase family protein n=1 Tax=Micrococcaceae TaxID=1268 RepID=UPI001607A927|nr:MULTISPECIES: aminomethyl transferase family protein [Micrococcaceae]MBB5750023.1 glycine cleavage system aminomethyltransferase T [Micrococcus sp. TA1]HRO30718.1 aminomethyl transferase family protein [Citricoccus sp.]HRO94367.1 aminomethyl transferase family protein [Citricoccus sp.]
MTVYAPQAATTESAAQAIARVGSPVEMLRNAQSRPTIFPVTPEFSNWRSEQLAWRDSVALLDQSHHMTDLFISGPDALRLLSDTGVNSFATFGVDKAKQFVAVNHEGYLIGDAILFHLEEDRFDLVGWFMVLDWVQYIGETGDYDVTFERDANSLMRTPGQDPALYRYEVQGPRALDLMEKVTGAPVPKTRFFHMTTFTIAGVEVRSLRHGMAGQPGFELFGPWAEGQRVRKALIEAGAEFDLVPVGAKAYSSANLESAWVPSPLPAIFTGQGMDAYLDWLPAARTGSLAGSATSEDIEDYYLTPYDLGYGRSVAFDHDFIGRRALERLAQEPQRTKVTLVWNPEDVAAAQRSLYEPGTPAKYIDFPKARYGVYQVDRVLAGGADIGISHDAGYITGEQVFVSLASVEASHAEPGTEVSVMWGEEPNSAKPTVERHRQVQIRATVYPAPYSSYAREDYRRD